MIGVLLAVVLIALAVTGKTQNTGYPAAVIWGLLGIQTRYLPDFRYDVQLESMWIVLVMALCLLVISIRWITIIIRRLK